VSDAGEDLTDEAPGVEEWIADELGAEAGLEETGPQTSDQRSPGVADDRDADVDVAQFDEAGSLLDDPEPTARFPGGIDTVDDADG
jgi:hypothetical protein